MIKCKVCNNYIPTDEIFIEEYFVLNTKIKKFIENEDTFKLVFFKKLIQSFQSKSKINLCFCIDNLQQKESYLNKYIKEKERLKEKLLSSSKNLFVINNNINIIETKLDIMGILKKEERFLFFKHNNDYKIVSYLTFIDLLKNNKIENNNSLLIVYGLEFLLKNDKKEGNYYYDQKIIDVLKYRQLKGLTTYLIYTYTKPLNRLINQIKKINNEEVKIYYNSLLSNNEIKEIKKIKEKNKELYYFKQDNQ